MGSCPLAVLLRSLCAPPPVGRLDAQGRARTPSQQPRALGWGCEAAWARGGIVAACGAAAQPERSAAGRQTRCARVRTHSQSATARAEVGRRGDHLCCCGRLL